MKIKIPLVIDLEKFIPSEDDIESGWLLNPKELYKISKRIANTTGDLISMGEIETVFCAGLYANEYIEGHIKEFEWIPIQFAPKDGTPVLCKVPNEFKNQKNMAVLSYLNDYSGWSLPGFGGFNPTHFMRIPYIPEFSYE